MTAQPRLNTTSAFPAIKYYIATAIFFLDIGILFGGLNALRVAGIFNVPEIHQTHWTSTLIGGMTVIMFGQLFYFIALSIETPKWVNTSMIGVLVLLLLGAGSSYIAVWIPSSSLGGDNMVPLIKLASLLYLLLIAYVTVTGTRKFELKDEPAYIMIYAALLWMGIAQLFFLGYRGIIGPPFKIPYIYGFFSLTLFGSLSFVLPRLLDTKPRSRGTIIRDTVMISLSALLLLANELIDESLTILGLLGSVFWGLVGFLFILYVFDLIYKTGLSASLIGLSVALIMFGFFVFDTFMKAVFPTWVNASHAHFMFLGTLVITIISVGLQLIDREVDLVQFNDKIQRIAIGLAVFFIGVILLGFTLQFFAIAGYAGISLFVSLIIIEALILLNTS